MNVLMTCCLGDHMKSNIEDLRDAFPGIRIVGIDARKMYFNHNGVDKFYNVCKCSDDMYVDQVIDICRAESIDLILSFSSLDIVPFRARKDSFDRLGIKIALGLEGWNGTLNANDKYWFCTIAKNKGVKIVETCEKLVYSNADIERFARQIGSDRIVVKQVDSTGAKGMEVLDRHDLKDFFVYRKGAIAQKFLSGAEYSVDCFCKNGKVLFSCVKINYEMDLGVSIYSEVIDRPDLIEMCEKACWEFKLDGLVGFDLKADEYGEVFILECNPRPTATISLVKRAGVNLLKHLVEYYLTGNTDFEGEQLKYGTVVRRFREDYYE